MIATHQLGLVLLLYLSTAVLATPLGQQDHRRHRTEAVLGQQNRLRIYPVDFANRFRQMLARGPSPLLGSVSEEPEDLVEYDDFEQTPPMARMSYVALPDDIKPKGGKRYLGIDIPDYISASGKSDAIKNMSDKMKALG